MFVIWFKLNSIMVYEILQEIWLNEIYEGDLVSPKIFNVVI
jgi:hypothetical protein